MTPTPAASARPFHRKLTLVGFALAALALGACGKAPSAPPPVQTTPDATTAAPAPAPPGDTSVPDAATALAPAEAPKADAAAGRTNGTMSRSQESAAMPMPGQNNDHSAPLAPARRASGA